VNFYEMPTKSNILTHIAALGAILSSAGLIFFAYFGFENIVNIAHILRMFQPSLKLTYLFIQSCSTLLPFFLMNEGALIY